jgi:hypothetical protein
MSRIISYPYDNDIKDGDAWIGTESSTTRTRQYTAEALAKYLNVEGKISIGAQMTYEYVSQTLLGGGTFSLSSGGLNNYPFDSITSLTLSITDKSTQNVVAFLDYLVDSDILISKQNAISEFGHYKISSYSQNAINPSFYDLQLLFKGGNGNMTFLDIFDIVSFVLASDSNDKTFVFTQTVPATVWSITHNLIKYPSVTAVNINNVVYYGNVTYVDTDSLTIEFSAGFSGKAYLN